MNSSYKRHVISDLTELPSVFSEIKYAKERTDIYDLYQIQLPRERDA
jgi:hypothetical protein